MICLRCGYCCVNLDVAIVNPVSILPDGTVDARDPGSVIFKPKGQRCPHLICHEGKATCSIHTFSCYQGTPCQQFEQFGREDDVCMLGSYYKASKPAGR